MASSSQIRAWWSSYRCRTSAFTRVTFPDGWNLWVAYEAAPAFVAFADLMQKHGYLFRDTSGGTYNCRKISGTDVWSLHAYALAIDLNPTVNRYGSPLRHDYPVEFIADVEALETVSGASVFQWGGRWGTPDAMHWQIDCSPADLATGIKETSMLRPEVEQFVNDLYDRMAELYPNAEVPTAAGLSTYLIPDVRRNIVTLDELQDIVASSSNVDEVARKLAQANAAKLARIKEAI